MAGQRGFLYEKTIYDMLLKNNLTTVKYRPSSSGHGADSAFKIKNKFYKLEVKLELAADFGQGTLRYDIDNQTWTTYAESETMKKILDDFEVAEFANDEWKSKTMVPQVRYRSVDIDKKRAKTTTLLPNGKNLTMADDSKDFPSKYKDLRGNKIAEYYNSKDVYYIQIGYNKGFYYMGQDIANLGVPEFNPPQQRIRIRRKENRFSTAIVIGTNIPSSLYNLDYNAIFLL